MDKYWALYYRVSDAKKDKEKYSIPIQIESARKIAEAKGWKYIEYNEGVKSSDQLEDQTKLKEILAGIEAGKIEGTHVIEIERLGRPDNFVDWAKVFDIHRRNKARISTPERIYNPCDENDSFDLILRGGLSRREKSVFLRRSAAGTKKAAENGIYLGSRYVVYGYKYDKYRPPKERRLEIIPEEAEVVKIICNMYEEGHSSTKIADWLNDNGYKPRTGKRFYGKFICDMLKNRTYTGYLVWNKCRYDKTKQNLNEKKKWVKNPENEWIIAKGRHEAIISVERFNNIQQILASRRPLGPRSIPSLYLLSGLMKCSLCGENYCGARVTSNRRLKIYKRRYYCMTVKKHDSKKYCKAKSMIAENVETKVIQKVKEIYLKRNSLEKIKENIKVQLGSKNTDEAIDLLYKKTQLEETHRKEDALMKLKLDEDISSEEFRRQNEELLEDEKRISRAIKKLENDIFTKKTTEYNLDTIFAILSDFDRLFYLLQPIKQKMVLHAVINHIIMDGKEIKHIEYNELFKSLLVPEYQEVKL